MLLGCCAGGGTVVVAEDGEVSGESVKGVDMRDWEDLAQSEVEIGV